MLRRVFTVEGALVATCSAPAAAQIAPLNRTYAIQASQACVPERNAETRNERLNITTSFFVDGSGRVFYFFRRDDGNRPEGLTARIGRGGETGRTPWVFTSSINGRDVSREDQIPFEMTASLAGNVLSLESSITYSGRWPDGQALTLFRAALERIELCTDGSCRLLSSNSGFRVTSGNRLLRGEHCRAPVEQASCSSTIGPPPWMRPWGRGASRAVVARAVFGVDLISRSGAGQCPS
jgi:hypothetical protein